MHLSNRIEGSLYGLLIGDALAMPVHWYYDTAALRRDYGIVDRYVAPRNPHPDSILWRSTYVATSPSTDLLRDQIAYWGQHGIHYHQFLQAGENTLNLKLCAELMDSLLDQRGYDLSDGLQRYVSFMTKPGQHNDTYVEECHRGFFANYGRGTPPERCGIPEKHIGGIPFVVPVTIWYADDPKAAERNALAHLQLTHPGPAMAEAGRVVIGLLLEVLSGVRLVDALNACIEDQVSPFFGHPFAALLASDDRRVVGGHFSPACYVQDALPAAIYLALKYHDRPREALIANTMLGGDNAHRGAVLGALLGAEHGAAAFPRSWCRDLAARDKLQVFAAHWQNA